jgi:hypothetical protein
LIYVDLPIPNGDFPQLAVSLPEDSDHVSTHQPPKNRLGHPCRILGSWGTAATGATASF